jgi:AsmA-like C-terminal region
MRRSLMTRHLALAFLGVVSALLFVAVASLFWDARNGEVGRSILGVQVFQADTVVIEQPVRLSQSPGILLTSGVLTQASGAPGTGRGVVLTSAVLELDLASDDKAISAGVSVGRTILSPLLDHLAALSVERISLRKAFVRVRLARGQTLELADIDANLAIRNAQVTSAAGTLSYLGVAYSFDTQIGAPIDRAADGDPRGGARRPVQLKLSSPCLSVQFDGHAEGPDGVLGLKGMADVRTVDAGKLAAELGYRWSESATGPEVLVKGPVRWALGTISFGRSEVALGDQAGVGAITMSANDGRPRIEATIAFPALDAAPLLQRESAAKTAGAPWRSISTSFPFIKRLDAELRVSAARLQWNGAPIGKGAITVSATGSKLHGDIAELQLENHTGSLQFAVDHTAAEAPVSLRGRFDTSDAGPVLAQTFGTALVRGRATSTFDVSGRGATLGEVLVHAKGRGTLEMRDGQMLMDLPALQKQIASIAGGERPAGWGALAQIAPLDALDGKFQVRDGSVVFENLGAVSKGLVASIQGRLGLAAADVDITVRISPAATSARTGAARSSAAAAGRAANSREVLSVRGPWSAPLLSAVEIELTP